MNEIVICCWGFSKRWEGEFAGFKNLREKLSIYHGQHEHRIKVTLNKLERKLHIIWIYNENAADEQ